MHPALGARSSGTTLRTLAALVVVVAGLKVAQPLLLPIVVAGFVALVALPLQARLGRWGMSKGLAIATTLLIALVSLLGFTILLATSLSAFARELPELRHDIGDQVESVGAWLRTHGLAQGEQGLRDKLDPGALLGLVEWATSGVLSTLSSFVVILLITIFALVEAEAVPAKLRHAFGRADADLRPYEAMARAVGTYAFWKTTLNAFTGVLVGLTCWLCGVREPVLWGLMAFLFNFVPNIGSLIVMVPIVLVAWAELGTGRALLVGALYLGVNQLVGSVIEPRLMGRKMGLSPLVVLLSLLFWGWLWGPVGMLLSVPLTMIVRSLLMLTPDGRSLGVLLGPSIDEPAPPA